jgi:hypothetical protein
MLADAVAETAEIYNRNGQLVWLTGGQLVPLSRDALREIITQHVAIKQLVNNGSAAEPTWTSAFVPLIPDEKILRTLLNADKREGGLRERVTKV